MANETDGKDGDGAPRPSAWADLFNVLKPESQDESPASSKGAALARDLRQRLVVEQKIKEAHADPQSSVVRLEPKSAETDATASGKAKSSRGTLATAKKAARDAYAKTRFPDLPDTVRVVPLADPLGESSPEQDVVWADTAETAPICEPEAEQTPAFGRRATPEAPMEEPVAPLNEPVEALHTPVAPVVPPPERIVLGVPLSAVVRYKEADFVLANLDRPARNPATLAFEAPLPQTQRVMTQAPSPVAPLQAFTLPRLPAAFGKFAAFGLIGLSGLVGIALILALGLLPTK